MKLRTSFFNTTVLKKDITRFAPLWGLYTVFMLLFIMLLWDAEGSGQRIMNIAGEIYASMGVLNLAYAGLCAVLLFSDLFQPRMCNMLHAFPMRREGWFLTHLTAGMLFCLVPNALGALIMALLMGQYAYGAFLWLGLMALQFLCFFGLGVFSALCSGNKLGVAAVYGITNFFAVLAAWLVQTFYEPFLYGIRIDLQPIARLSPVVMFTESQYIYTSYDKMKNITVLEKIYPEAWTYLAVAAAVGVALLALAMLIYRRRPLETAGSLIALKPVAPVFLVIYTLCVGAVIFFVAGEATGDLGYFFLFVGLAIGFFTGRMLLEKKVNVFRGKNFLAFGVLLAIFAASIGLTVLDPAGITRYVPETEQVKQVTISPYSSRYYINNDKCTLTEQEDIEQILALHRYALENRADVTSVFMSIQYELTDGTRVERNYYLPEEEAIIKKLESFYSRPVCVLGTENLEALLEDLYSLDLYSHDDTMSSVFINNTGGPLYDQGKWDGEAVVKYNTEGALKDHAQARGLVEALYADCQAGTMSRWRPEGITCGGVVLEVRKDGYTVSYDFPVYADSENTVAYLRSLLTE